MKKLTLLAVLLLTLACISPSAFAWGTLGSPQNSGWLWPTDGSKYLTRGFRDDTQGEISHWGLDISTKGKVLATKDGTVVQVYRGCRNVNGANKNVSDCSDRGVCSPSTGKYSKMSDGGYYCNDGYGNGVVIDHGDGTYSYYAHMKADTITLEVGMTVKQGQPLGEIGASGCADGVHLHFGIGKNQFGIDEGGNNAFNCNPSNPELGISIEKGIAGNHHWRTDSQGRPYDPDGVHYITNANTDQGGNTPVTPVSPVTFSNFSIIEQSGSTARASIKWSNPSGLRITQVGMMYSKNHIQDETLTLNLINSCLAPDFRFALVTEDLAADFQTIQTAFFREYLENLEGNCTYYVRPYVVDSAGNIYIYSGEYSFQSAQMSVVAPDTVEVWQTNNVVSVSFHAVENTSGYDVYLIQEPWGWEDIKYHISTTATQANFENVAAGDYAAFVIPKNSNPYGPQSPWQSIHVASIAEIPQNVRAEQQGNKMRVTFDPVENALGYTVYVLAPPHYWADLKYSMYTTEPLAEFIDIEPGTYSVFVMTKFADWESPTSAWTYVTYEEPVVVPPAMPSVWQIENLVTVSFNPVSNTSGYDVYFVTEPWDWADIKYHQSTTETTVTFADIAPGYYRVFVIPKNSNPYGPQSEWCPFNVASSAQIPQNVHGEQQGETLKILFDPAVGAVGHTVYLIQPPYTWDDVKYSTYTTESYAEFNDVASGTYTAFVVAKFADWESPQSTWVSVTYEEPVIVAPAMPSVWQINNIVSVSFNAVENTTGYDVYMIQDPWGWNDVKYHKSTTDTTVTFENVAAGNYAVFVIPKNRNPEGPQSEWRNFYVASVADIPQNVRAEQVYNRMQVSFDPVVNAIGYNVSLVQPSGTWYDVKYSAYTTEPSTDLKDLVPGQYDVYVTARFADWESPTSAWVPVSYASPMYEFCLTLPGMLSVIEQEALAGTLAEMIVIPAGVTRIESKAFASSPNLKALVFEGNSAEIAEDILYGCTNVTIRCKEGSSADRWANACGYNVEYQ